MGKYIAKLIIKIFLAIFTPAMAPLDLCLMLIFFLSGYKPGGFILTKFWVGMIKDI